MSWLVNLSVFGLYLSCIFLFVCCKLFIIEFQLSLPELPNGESVFFALLGVSYGGGKGKFGGGSSRS